jgi:segregation and condensation protein B
MDELLFKVEAVLFSYGDWISISEICDSVGEKSDTKVKSVLKDLVEKFKEGYSFEVQNEDERFRMVLLDAYDEVASSLISGTEIPRNVLKVLSVIAYEQPITKTRLSEILGRYVKEEVDYLFKAKFVNYEKHGIGKYYRVTKKFYDYFKMDKPEEFREKANSNINTFLKSDEQIAKDIGLEYVDVEGDKIESEDLENSDSSEKKLVENFDEEIEKEEENEVESDQEIVKDEK